jgi:hypothetical protein
MIKEIAGSSPGTATPLDSIHNDDAVRRLLAAKSLLPYLQASSEPTGARAILLETEMSARFMIQTQDALPTITLFFHCRCDIAGILSSAKCLMSINIFQKHALKSIVVVHPA